jgi:hypothetical protein
VQHLILELEGLDAAARHALSQLCSTAHLSTGRLDDLACGILAMRQLAWKDQDGYWSATTRGKKLFAVLENARHAPARSA